MLRFVEASVNVDKFYYFRSEDGKLYYWKTNKEEVANACYDHGRLVGIKALEYEVKKNGKKLFHNGEYYEEVKVNKWEICS